MSEFGGGSEVSDTREGTKDGVVGKKVEAGMPKRWRPSPNAIRAIQGLPPIEGAVGAESEVENGKVEITPSVAVQLKPEVPATKPVAPLGSKGRNAMQGN